MNRLLFRSSWRQKKSTFSTKYLKKSLDVTVLQKCQTFWSIWNVNWLNIMREIHNNTQINPTQFPIFWGFEGSFLSTYYNDRLTSFVQTKVFCIVSAPVTFCWGLKRPRNWPLICPQPHDATVTWKILKKVQKSGKITL